MNPDETNQNETTPDSLIWERIEHYCLKHGWTISRLAEVSGVSRATLYQWQKHKACKPRHDTLHKLASALSVSPAVLKSESRNEESSTTIASSSPFETSASRSARPQWVEDDTESRRTFDRQSNWAIQEVCQNHPELFADWSDEQWDELFSTFGIGGELNETGVLKQAEAINAKRETIYQLQVVLETHLADAARNVIRSLYDSVQCASIDMTNEQIHQSGDKGVGQALPDDKRGDTQISLISN
ncbi:helix-turn-helix transcriptional regulator [Rubinisphaera sp.]|uniref:helix-turn-helix domain-containing protein n=1 Tax=Rubinisphaera sp. TaxID=2024857 RepID=UPI002600ABE2|nr:helix-turn-helix transcriptional regulator [Rubinisphaera sp.]